ncbi:MAG: SufD family Fe-S cluster assembly protein [Anaeroplasmataceae bacterium]|nr:SufD family Fe-S cluster assembly protein [Anaeroplasmataceae bacterium]
MIELSTLKHSNEDLGLIFKDQCWYVQKSIKEPILIQDNAHIIVSKGIHTSFIEIASDASIKLEVIEDAFVEYQMINSKNMKRNFKCYGTLNLMQICLEATDESLEVHLLKEGASSKLELLSIMNQDDTVFHQQMNHLCPNTESNISNFGVTLDGASILYDTVGKIEKGMSKSKCVQLSKGIVLDDSSAVTSRPILLIDEYDVIANHGASIGKMSDDMLFYMMSRVF